MKRGPRGHAAHALVVVARSDQPGHPRRVFLGIPEPVVVAEVASGDQVVHQVWMVEAQRAIDNGYVGAGAKCHEPGIFHVDVFIPPAELAGVAKVPLAAVVRILVRVLERQALVEQFLTF